jgi:hypothetical protein
MLMNLEENVRRSRRERRPWGRAKTTRSGGYASNTMNSAKMYPTKPSFSPRTLKT